MQRAECLRAAGAAVADRGLNYGRPEDNFARIARLWNAHLKNRNLLRFSYGVEEGDIAIMLGQVKDARLANDMTHADSWIDKAGYAACGSEVSVGRPDGTRPAGDVVQGPWPANATPGNPLGLMELTPAGLASMPEKGETEYCGCIPGLACTAAFCPRPPVSTHK